MRNLLISMAGLVMLASCASSPVPLAKGHTGPDVYLFFRDGNPSDFSSKIIFSRTRGSFGGLYSWDLLVDGKTVASLPTGKTFELDVKSGPHEIAIVAMGINQAVRTVHFFRGSILYLDMEYRGISTAPTSGVDPNSNDGYLFSWRDTPLPPYIEPVTTTTSTPAKE